MRKWEDLFIFENELKSSNPRKFIEDSITSEFFKLGKNLNEIKEEDEEDSHPEEESKDVDPDLKKKKQIVSAIYKNFQEIMNQPTTTCERIRDTSAPTNAGLPN